MNESSRPALIAVDWGTSSLRAYLFDDRAVLLDRRTRPWGIQHLPEGGYAAAFRGIVGDWLANSPALPVIAAGMVGSRQGWHEVPYVACPADPATLAAGLVAFESQCGLLHLVPGISQGHPHPDVMRGEETQIVGALSVSADLEGESLCVLPGTHSKWAMVRDGRVTRFTTYLTGELFALLRDHSILGRPARDAGGTIHAGSTDAFVRGVDTARASGAEGIAGRLFTVRSLFLSGLLPAEHTLDYLSGLLVGEEIRSAGTALGSLDCPLVLLGDAALCDRYRVALAHFGVDHVRSLDDTGPAGLWRIAAAAGLVEPAKPAA